mgnify:CR=1 FL=1
MTVVLYKTEYEINAQSPLRYTTVVSFTVAPYKPARTTLLSAWAELEADTLSLQHYTQ